MASAPLVPTTGAVLRWARIEAGLTAEEAAHRITVKPDRIVAWEEDRTHPTMNQLRNMARTYRRTPAFFLLPEPPADDSARRPPDFRAASGGKIAPELSRELLKVRERRSTFLRLTEDPPQPFPQIGDVLENPVGAAREFRRILGVSLRDQFAFKDPAAAFRGWVNAVERQGALIFHMSRIPFAECRAVSLYEPVAPIIILNGADDPQARIFSLIHETAHLLAHSGGLCGVYAGAGVERSCNRFAGELLMPEETFLRELGTEVAIDSLARLSARFRVSQSSVAVRLRDLERISQRQLDEQLAVASRLANERRERDRKKDGGPAHYVTHLRNLGGSYVGTVLEALHEDRISQVDASYFLEAKTGTIDRMEAELANRSVPA